MNASSSAASSSLSARAEWLLLLAFPTLCIVVAALALPHPAGVEQARARVDRSALAGVVHPTRPAIGSAIDVDLGGIIRVLGAELSASAAPGSSLAVKTHFEVLGEVDRDWKVFLHIDKRSGSFRVHGDHPPAGGRYPTSTWRTGEFVTDDFEARVPLDAPPGDYEAFLGFYIGDERLPVTAGTRHDAENRVRLGRVRVE